MLNLEKDMLMGYKLQHLFLLYADIINALFSFLSNFLSITSNVN
jgi:hypothetical protein